MTAEWYDLGQRLYAASRGEVVARLRHAATAEPGNRSVVAVRASAVDGRVTAAIADRTAGLVQAQDGDVLAALAASGVTMTTDRPALAVLDSLDTLAVLDRLARLAAPGTADDDVAAHIAWWCDQADFPGGHAVVDVTAACQTRWVTGIAPRDETKPETWRAWLGIADASVAGLLDLHNRLTDGLPLPVLDVLAEDSDYAWGYAQRSHGEGRDWRWPDTTGRAALGLRSRCDAADLYADGLLDDPIYRRRAVHTGQVVVGTAQRPDDPKWRRSFRVRCDRLDARLRPGTPVVGWVGGVEQSGGRYSGVVSGAEVERGTLVLTVSSLGGAAPTDSDPVVLHEAPTAPAQVRAASKRYRALYSARRSWLTTGRPATTTRRTVPLDVLVAGADPE